MVKKYVKLADDVKQDAEVELVRHGDFILLEHIPTKRNLHSHKEHAPVTKKHYQVSGYGEVIKSFF